MELLLICRTKVGDFYIGQSSDDRFHPIYDNESLGSYEEIWQATEDLANDATFSILHPMSSDVLDTSILGIPEEPSKWERV